MADNLNAVPYMAFGYGQLNTAVRNGVSDSNVSANSGDTIIALTTLTAARTVTLPSAGSVTPGKQMVVKDESGTCSGGNTITVTGVETIVGSAYNDDITMGAGITSGNISLGVGTGDILRLANEARQWRAHKAAQQSLPQKKVVPKSAVKALTTDGGQPEGGC